MKKLEWIIDQIDEELEDSEKYIDKALKCKEHEPDWANAYYQISQQEMAHAEVLHGQAVQAIREYKGDVPMGMEWIWNREHEEYIDHAARIKMKWELYRK